jgi:hypothetical protein
MGVTTRESYIKLNFYEKSIHYGLVFASIFIAFLPLIANIIDLLRGKDYKINWGNDFSYWSLLFIILGLIVWAHQRALLKLEKVVTSQEAKVIRNILIKVAEEKEWSIDHNTSENFSVKIRKLFSTELVIVLYKKDHILIGSINSPYTRNSFGSLLRFRKNRQLIKEKIKN